MSSKHSLRLVALEFGSNKGHSAHPAGAARRMIDSARTERSAQGRARFWRGGANPARERRSGICHEAPPCQRQQSRDRPGLDNQSNIRALNPLLFPEEIGSSTVVTHLCRKLTFNTRSPPASAAGAFLQSSLSEGPGRRHLAAPQHLRAGHSR
jgi:hypothetical protein